MEMWLEFFKKLEIVEDALWGYLGFPAILLMGAWLSYTSGFVQLRKFPIVCRTFFHFLFHKVGRENSPGIHPLKTFFAALGGCVGIGNVVAITTAVQIGGPGALLWIWMTAFAGSLVKYSEVYLGIKYRERKGETGYSGGPMFYLSKAWAPWASTLFCILLCIYGVEIYQFSVVTSSLSSVFEIDKVYVTFFLLLFVVLAELGGLRRVGNISSVMIPAFIVIYLSMGMWVLIHEMHAIPAVIKDIFIGAFTPSAAIGGFAGSALLTTISQGIRRGCYSSDIGVGYASIIYSESKVKNPATQASLVIFEVFLDTFVICTMSVVLVLITGTWATKIDPMRLVQVSLSKYFPYMHYFMPLFLFLLGYSTIITYFFAGIRTAQFISPRYGRYVYYVYAAVVLWTFSFVETSQAQSVMTIVGALLLALNITGIWRLRRELRFDFE